MNSIPIRASVALWLSVAATRICCAKHAGGVYSPRCKQVSVAVSVYLAGSHSHTWAKRGRTDDP